MNSHIHRALARARYDDLRRRSAGPPAEAEIRIRAGGPADAGALARLAALDSADVPPSPVLLAEVDGEAWAARSLLTGQVVASPFRATAVLVELLAARSGQLRAPALSR
jgi:hypothetical protein